MGAIVGVGAVEVVELHLALVQAHAVIDVGHRELVLVGEEYPFG